VVLNSLKSVKGAKELDSKLFSLPRLQILSALYLLGGEYAFYRDLKAGLELNDGILFFNLQALERMSYIGKREEEFQGKKMDAYCITLEGIDAFKKTISWVKDFSKENAEGIK